MIYYHRWYFPINQRRYWSTRYFATWSEKQKDIWTKYASRLICYICFTICWMGFDLFVVPFTPSSVANSNKFQFHFFKCGNELQSNWDYYLCQDNSHRQTEKKIKAITMNDFVVASLLIVTTSCSIANLSETACCQATDIKKSVDCLKNSLYGSIWNVYFFHFFWSIKFMECNLARLNNVLLWTDLKLLVSKQLVLIPVACFKFWLPGS